MNYLIKIDVFQYSQYSDLECPTFDKIVLGHSHKLKCKFDNLTNCMKMSVLIIESIHYENGESLFVIKQNFEMISFQISLNFKINQS